MDFAKLDLRRTAEDEYWLHLRAGTMLFYADEATKQRPSEVQILSPSSPEVEGLLKSIERVGKLFARTEMSLVGSSAAQARRETERQLDALDKEAEALLTRFLVQSIRNWRNIMVDGEELPFTQENLLDMAQPKAPLFRLAQFIAEDAGRALDPFSVPAGG